MGITLVLEFKNIESGNKSKYDNFYLNSKLGAVVNESGNDGVIESIYIIIKLIIQLLVGKDSCWITDSVIDHNSNIWKYNLLPGSIYTKLPKK